MSWDPCETNWDQFSGQLKEKWVDLTDEDLAVIHTKLDQLAWLIQDLPENTADRALAPRDDYTTAL